MVQQIFNWILNEINDAGYLSPEAVFIDGTHIKASASMKKAIDMMKTMEAMNTQQSTDSLYRHYQSRTASETEGEENYDNTESQSSQDIYSSVKDLFEKYDMEGY